MKMIIKPAIRASIEPTMRPALPGHYEIETNHGTYIEDVFGGGTSVKCYKSSLLFIPDDGSEAERPRVQRIRVEGAIDNLDAAQQSYDQMLPIFEAYVAWFHRTGQRWEVLQVLREKEIFKAYREGRKPPLRLRMKPPSKGRGPL